MMGFQTCPKCNHSRIAGPHRVHADRGHSKIDLPGLSTATLQAFTCVNCGYTELYADRMGRDNIKRSGRFTSRPRTSSRSRLRRDDVCLTCGALISGETIFCHDCGSKLV